MIDTMTPPVVELSDTDDTCPACHGSGFVGDFDDVTYCDAPGCFAMRPVPLTAGFPEHGTPEQQADWDRRYRAILDDGWLPGEPYVPALYGR